MARKGKAIDALHGQRASCRFNGVASTALNRNVQSQKCPTKVEMIHYYKAGEHMYHNGCTPFAHPQLASGLMSISKGNPTSHRRMSHILQGCPSSTRNQTIADPLQLVAPLKTLHMSSIISYTPNTTHG